MDINGEKRITATRQRVWEALNDPEILKECIMGCDELEKISDSEMRATVIAKFGPVKAGFKATISIEDPVAPERYRLVGEGQGGVAGFAKGAADILLEEAGDETVLRYQAQMQIGGKLAQVGSRLVGGTTNKIINEFFTRFAERV